MFHSLGLEKHPWRSQYISEPIRVMASKMRQISKDGYESVFMAEAQSVEFKKSKKYIHINFDDGYLDNWVHLFPILTELKLKTTIYISSDFIDPRDIVRKQVDKLEHISGNAHHCCAGFLSFKEMRLMESSGLVEIQSHAKSHTWYFKGSKIVDFWRPGSATQKGGPVWMLWNAFPEEKPYYLTKAAELEHKIPYGTPIYEHGKSLETTRFFPEDIILQEKLIARVASEKDFFNHKDWKNILNSIVDLESDIKGEFESESDYLKRVEVELKDSKAIIEEGLGHEIKGVCWPGGGVKEKVVEIAKKLGYSYFTLPSKWKRSPNNLYSEMIPRIGPLSRLTFKGRDIGEPSALDFSLYLKSHNGNKLAKWGFFVKRLIKFLSYELSSFFK